MAGTIGSMQVFMKVNTAGYSKGLKQAKSDTTSFSAGFKTLGLGIAGVGVAAATAATAIVTKFASMGDEIAKGAKRAMMGTSDFQSLGYALEQSGGSAQMIGTGVKKLNTELMTGLTTGGKSAKMFKFLGLNMEDVNKMDSADKLRAITKGLATVANEGMRSEIAVALLGKAGPTFATMAGDVEGLENSFKDLGAEITGEELEAAEELTDQFNNMKKMFMKVTAQIGSQLAPIFMSIGDIIISVTKEIGYMIEAFKWFTGTESTKSVDKIGKGLDATTKAAAGGGQADTTMFDTANKELTIAEKEQASIAKQIANQETMIQELEKQNSQLAPLPQALGKGTAAQISFLNNFKRQSKQDQILKKHNQEIENQKEQLEVMKKQLKVAEDAVKDKKETVSLLSITQ